MLCTVPQRGQIIFFQELPCDMKRRIVDPTQNHAIGGKGDSPILTGNRRTKEHFGKLQIVFPIVAHLEHHINNNAFQPLHIRKDIGIIKPVKRLYRRIYRHFCMNTDIKPVKRSVFIEILLDAE